MAFAFDDHGRPQPGRSGGGLAATLGAGVRAEHTQWIAAAITDADRAAGTDELVVDGYRLRLVDIGADLYGAAYNEVANNTLWFWHHHMFDSARRPVLDAEFRDAWAAYRVYNEAMAEAAAHAVAANGTVLIHDYHLALVPAALRERRPDIRIAHFTHTPWVSPALLGLLPDDISEELLRGMAGADACGFHAARWADAFAGCWREHPATAAEPAPRTFVAPAAADHVEVAEVAANDECAAELALFDAVVGERACIVRVDRIEPSKNLLRGFWAFRALLEAHPEWQGRVCMLAMCYPSRETLEEYKTLAAEVHDAVDALNREYGSDDWTPVILDTTDGFARSVAALRRANVLFVNPIRDGLNLVAYEGSAINEHHAPLVLSREAGAWDELGPAGALPINPFDVVGTAEALHRALALDTAERFDRAERLRAVATARTPAAWLASQVAAAEAAD